jgi:hypothetical protein
MRVGSLSGHGRSASHRHAHVRLLECRRIVHPIAGNGDGAAGGPRGLNEPQLLLRRRTRDNVETGQRSPERLVIHRVEVRAGQYPFAGQSCCAGDGGRRRRMVAGDDDRLDAGLGRAPQRIRDPGPERVRERQDRAWRPVLIVGP